MDINEVADVGNIEMADREKGFNIEMADREKGFNIEMADREKGVQYRDG